MTKVWWKYSKEILSITNVLFHVDTINNYMIFFLFPFFHVVGKWKAHEKAMEDLHKASVHELNNEFI
jgi:hypothetical protein